MFRKGFDDILALRFFPRSVVGGKEKKVTYEKLTIALKKEKQKNCMSKQSGWAHV